MNDALDLTTVNPALLGQVVLLADREPNHPLVVAVRLAVELITARRERRIALAEASSDISCGTDWAQVANNHVSFTDLQLYRIQPLTPAPIEVDPELAAAFETAS